MEAGRSYSTGKMASELQHHVGKAASVACQSLNLSLWQTRKSAHDYPTRVLSEILGSLSTVPPAALSLAAEAHGLSAELGFRIDDNSRLQALGTSLAV